MAEDLKNSDIFQKFTGLLDENDRQAASSDLSLMAWYLDGMERQFDTVLNELKDVKQQLAELSQQTPPQKAFFSVLNTLEEKVCQAREHLLDFRDRIISCVKDAIDRFKDTGVSALDRAVSAMGVKKGLESLHEKLQESVSGTKAAIDRGEQAGRELRSAWAHLKSGILAAGGKDVPASETNPAGRFEAAVLAPVEVINKLLTNMDNNTLAAIGVVEHLEESAEASKEKHTKPSVRKALAENRADIAARPSPAPDKARKPPEAAL